MIHKNEKRFGFDIVKAECDCCGENIPVQFGRLPNHLTIGGYVDQKLLEAVVCEKCYEDKFGFMTIHKRTNSLGFC